MVIFAVAFASALFVSALVTPLVRWLAWRYQFVDNPDGGRKVHGMPVAFGGGLVLFFATFVSVLICAQFIESTHPHDLATFSSQSLVLVLAILLIVGVGLWDDKYLLRGRTKLFFQFVAAAMVVASGPNIESVSMGGITLHLGNLGVFFSMLWILGSINSFNLIDGVDGLASTIGLVISVAVGTIAMTRGDFGFALIVFSLAGALVGFLFFNWTPASIYLGDSGSMMIGLILGVIALRSTVKEATSVAFAPLLAIWAILILDSAAAVVRRTMTGRSIYCTDRGHIHHRFISKGFTHGQISLCIGGLCAFTSCGAVTSVMQNSEFTGFLVAIAAVLALAVTRVFGHTEFSLLSKHLMRVGRSKLRLRGTPQSSHNALAIQLQGNHHWNELWTAFLESTDRYGLVHLRLNLHLPRFQEDFFAHWATRDVYDDDMTWSLERPLMCDGMCIGRLSVRGKHMTTLPGASNVSLDFLECLESLEEQLQQVVSGLYTERESRLKGTLEAHPSQEVSATR